MQVSPIFFQDTFMEASCRNARYGETEVSGKYLLIKKDRITFTILILAPANMVVGKTVSIPEWMNVFTGDDGMLRAKICCEPLPGTVRNSNFLISYFLA